MNFDYSEDQLAIREVADRMFKDLCSDDAIRALNKDTLPLHRELWKALAEAGLLGAVLPAEYGGSDLGMTEFGLLAEAQGRGVAPVPLIDTVIEAALPIAQAGSAALKARILPGVCNGELMLSAVRSYDGLLERKALCATREGAQWQLDGSSTWVSYGAIANGFLVTARTESGEDWVGYVDAGTTGVEVIVQRATSGEPAARLIFNNVRVDADNVLAVGNEASDLIEWTTQRSYIALAAQQVGILREGLRRAAEYTNERKQFGRALSSFQAVAQQAADAYMAIEALLSVYWRALDDLEHRGEARLSARVAKFWLCESGHIAAHIYLHIHGGIGQDLDYPLHRFFTWAKKNEHYLGGADKQARTLGELFRQQPDPAYAEHHSH